MNVKKVVAVALVCGLTGLTGCAGMSKKGDSSASLYLNSGLSDDVDIAYITQVNEEAIRHFGAVLWVNPPQKQTIAQQ